MKMHLKYGKSHQRSAYNTKRYNAQTFARLQTGYVMHASTFIFAAKRLNECFYRLDNIICFPAGRPFLRHPL
ncbi:hypothetical protein [Paraburkholderia sp. D1E]|uniref:hypothetical protein n=1 Tax=Paraburkholderia sp. D1E TaxID=3461398 RepID=UPI004045B624